MKLLNVYENQWVYNIPYKVIGRDHYYLQIYKSERVYVSYQIDDLRDDEVDRIFNDNEISILPRDCQLHLVKEVFETRHEL